MLVLVSRILMGLIYFVFGLNGVLMVVRGEGFIPMPPPSPEMLPIFTGFMAMKYLFPLAKILEVVGGALLLSGKRTALALVLLTPITVNIVGIHTFVDMSGLPMSMALTFFTIVLIRSEWYRFAPLLR